MKRFLLACALPLLMAASCDQTKPSQAVDCHLDRLCRTPCADLPGWDGNRQPERLEALMDAHDALNAECDKHRQACVDCIDTGIQARALKADH